MPAGAVLKFSPSEISPTTLPMLAFATAASGVKARAIRRIFGVYLRPRQLAERPTEQLKPGAQRALSQRILLTPWLY
jgi:hypothetical protein